MKNPGPLDQKWVLYALIKTQNSIAITSITLLLNVVEKKFLYMWALYF